MPPNLQKAGQRTSPVGPRSLDVDDETWHDHHEEKGR